MKEKGMIKINNGFYIKCSIHLLLKQDRNERVMNLKYQIAPTFKGGTFISYAVVQCLSLLHSFAN